jgi:Bacterial protein of unknown function (DUF899)
MTGMPEIVSAGKWQQDRDELLKAEKEATRALDALAARRRRLPMVKFDSTGYVFGTSARRTRATEERSSCRGRGAGRGRPRRCRDDRGRHDRSRSPGECRRRAGPSGRGGQLARCARCARCARRGRIGPPGERRYPVQLAAAGGGRRRVHGAEQRMGLRRCGVLGRGRPRRFHRDQVSHREFH